MTTFAEVLKELPSIEGIDAVELYIDVLQEPVAVIENKPGKAGSVAVYNALFEEFGVIDSDAAHKGLEYYAEHVADAETNPGKHPNIDRLFQIIDEDLRLTVNIVDKA